MNVIDEALEANKIYVASFTLGDLPKPPARKLAVVACMDARFMPGEALGLKPGDANLIRNAGGIITDDTIRSLIVSHHLLGTQEFMIINHTDCGMLNFDEAGLTDRLEKETGAAGAGPTHFHAFDDLVSNVRQQIQKVKGHPWIPSSIAVRGFIYDDKTGELNEVSAANGSSNNSSQEQLFAV